MLHRGVTPLRSQPGARRNVVEYVPSRPFTAAVLGAALWLTPAAADAAKPSPGRCRPPSDATVELRTRSAVLYTRYVSSDTGEERGRLAGCLGSTGRRRLLAGVGDEFDNNSSLRGVRLSGRFAAVAIDSGAGAGARPR